MRSTVKPLHILGWCTSGQAGFLEILGISSRGGVARGTLIFTFVHDIAEMKLSESYKNDFNFKKSIQPKLKFFEWEIGENLKKSGKFPDVMRQTPKI